MDNDFSFVLISTLQPLSSSKKKPKMKNSLVKNKKSQIMKKDTSYSSSNFSTETNTVKNVIKRNRNIFNKENNLNISNLHDLDKMKTKRKKSIELNHLIDLKNINTRSRYLKTVKKKENNIKTSDDVIDLVTPIKKKLDLPETSFCELSVYDSSNKSIINKNISTKTSNAKLGSFTNSLSPFEISINISKSRSSSKFSSPLFVSSPLENSLGSELIQKPRLRKCRGIMESSESDLSNIKNDKSTKTSISSNRMSSESKVSSIGSFRNNVKKNVNKQNSKRKSSTGIESTDVSIIEPTIITPKSKSGRNKFLISNSYNKKDFIKNKPEKTSYNKNKNLLGRSKSSNLLGKQNKSTGSVLKEINTSNKNNTRIKTNVNVSNKSKLNCSPKSITRSPSLVSPPLSPCKIESINCWLSETNKHIDEPKFNKTSTNKKNYTEPSVLSKSKSKSEKDEYEIISASDVSEISDENVAICEDILNKLYGSMWENVRSDVLPQSVKKKNKLTELPKKRRTSIYDVFSSSSSEDRFEQFLESVRKKKQLPKSYNNDVDSLDFINDSSSENDTSMTLYRTHFTKDIKSEASDTLSKRKLDQRTPKKTKVRRKKLKLSFSDSDTENKSKTAAKENKVKTKTVKNCDKGLENDNNLHFSKPPTNYNFWNNLQNDLTQKIKNPHTPDKKCIKNKIVGRDGIQNIKYMPPKSVKTNSKDTNEIKDNKSKSNILLTPKVPLLTPKTIKKECNPKFEDDIPTAWGSMEIMNTPLPKSSNTRTSPRLTLSFLSSLSEITGNMKCHPEAVIYKKEYKKKKEELACKLFYLYNKEIFESKLPSDMSIEWNARMRSTSGFCYNKRIFKANKEVVRSSRIVLSSKILDRADRLRDTLVHELCHAATWLVNGMSDGHGPHWRAWAAKANYRFPELPIIKRCHDYHIVTKYTYKCVDCGYCIGRHSKSLDTNRKRCGYCRGKFEVFLTSKMSTDKAPSEMTDTVKPSRTPSAFAMFVKNNYALVKQESKDLRHGDVMKLLGQKFAAVKLAQA